MIINLLLSLLCPQFCFPTRHFFFVRSFIRSRCRCMSVIFIRFLFSNPFSQWRPLCVMLKFSCQRLYVVAIPHVCIACTIWKVIRFMLWNGKAQLNHSIVFFFNRFQEISFFFSYLVLGTREEENSIDSKLNRFGHIFFYSSL